MQIIVERGCKPGDRELQVKRYKIAYPARILFAINAVGYKVKIMASHSYDRARGVLLSRPQE